MAHPQQDALLNYLLEFAQSQLRARGAFLPFGAVIQDNGVLDMVGAYTGDEKPSPQQLIELKTRAFRVEAAAGKLNAIGLCVDVRTTPPGATSKTDAICVSLEHRNGELVDVYLPYHKTAKGHFEFGQLFANQGGHRVFGV